MRKIFTFFITLGLFSAAAAQMKTYLTVEAGPQWSLVKVADQGGYFEGANVKSTIGGVTVGQEILPNLSVITGLYYQTYVDGINLIDQRPHQVRWPAYTALLIPVRGEYRVRVSEYPVSFTPRLGYVFGLVSQPGAPFDATGTISAPDGTALSYDVAQTIEPVNLHMLEVGIGFNLGFLSDWQGSLNLSYMTGFTEPLSSTITYTGQGATGMNASYTSNGNTLYTTLAFSLPVSNIWQNRDYRIRARIENSSFRGKPLDKRGQLYVGGDLGSLWRSFNQDDPAVGARPMTGRGIFRYANMHTGLYFGYMLSDELGIDLGAYYQRSSTFYAVMVDHEVDFVTKSPAPLFLEVPLRIRYFYNIYKHKIHYVVVGGASLLTHFSAGDFNQGGGDFTYNAPPSGTPFSATTSYTASRSARFRPVMRIGTGVEYLLPLPFPLIATCYVNYMQGFMSTDEIWISNAMQGGTSGSYVSYNGTGWSLDIGIKYPFKFGSKVPCGKPRVREE